MIKMTWAASLPNELLEEAVAAVERQVDYELETPREVKTVPPDFGTTEATTVMRWSVLGDPERFGSLWVVRNGFSTTVIVDRLPQAATTAGCLVTYLTERSGASAMVSVVGRVEDRPPARRPSIWRRIWEGLWPGLPDCR